MSQKVLLSACAGGETEIFVGEMGHAWIKLGTADSVDLDNRDFVDAEEIKAYMDTQDIVWGRIGKVIRFPSWARKSERGAAGAKHGAGSMPTDKQHTAASAVSTMSGTGASSTHGIVTVRLEITAGAAAGTDETAGIEATAQESPGGKAKRPRISSTASAS